ncbi:MAG: hypothetical protein JO285_13045 [Kutzneria sp.]|nr:hypothetical protein [Kutzneria sp.]
MQALATVAALADDPDTGGVMASDVFVEMDQDELDDLRRELESDRGLR